MTRREWTLLMAVAPAFAQVTSKVPPQGAPAPPNPPATPEERLKKAYSDVRTISDRLSKVELPMHIEPAFAFKV